MGCKTCAPYDHDEVTGVLRGSLYVMARSLCGFDKMTPSLHGRVARWVERCIARDRRRLLILLPRGHYKSSLISIAASLWFLSRDPESRILITHASSKVAVNFLRVCKSLVVGAKWGHYFPSQVPNVREHRFSEEELELPRRGVYPEASITARSVGTTVTGGHFDVQIFDDLVDENIARSPTKMQRVQEYLAHADPLFINPKSGLRIVVGTLWPGGFYEALLEHPRYEKLVLGCYKDERWERFTREIDGE